MHYRKKSLCSHAHNQMYREERQLSVINFYKGWYAIYSAKVILVYLKRKKTTPNPTAFCEHYAVYEYKVHLTLTARFYRRSGFINHLYARQLRLSDLNTETWSPGVKWFRWCSKDNPLPWSGKRDPA